MRSKRFGKEIISNKSIRGFIIIATLLILIPNGNSYAAKTAQRTFQSPDQAFETLISAVKNNNDRLLTDLFGSRVKEIFPVDPEVNARARERFVRAYDEKHGLENIGPNKVVLHVGEKDWPWPVPVVKAGKRWRFDTDTGIKEINARRIGKNEVSAVQVCLAYVDSQMEYAREHAVNGIGEYAQQLTSDPDKQNGLCWNSKDGEKQSLLGPMIAGACKTEVKSKTKTGMELAPYHGYYYRILKSQGKNSPGGAYSYIVNGKMIGGFALIAYPAHYGHTGITTFIVSKDGIVYQSDLGKDSEKIAESLDSYDPDPTWKKVD